MEKIVKYYLDVLARLKTLHWFAPTYTTHVRIGKLYDELSEEIDGLIESLMGSRKTPKAAPPRLKKNVIGLLEDLILYTESLDRAASRASVDNISFIASKYIYLLSMR